MLASAPFLTLEKVLSSKDLILSERLKTNEALLFFPSDITLVSPNWFLSASWALSILHAPPTEYNPFSPIVKVSSSFVTVLSAYAQKHLKNDIKITATVKQNKTPNDFLIIMLNSFSVL